MKKDADGNLTLTSPQAWENFGQWLIYGVVAFLAAAVIYMMVKFLFLNNDNDEKEKKP